MYKTADALQDFALYDADCAAAEELLPVCDECGARIREDTYFDIDGTIICEDCLNDYKKYTEDYIEEQKERRYYD